MNVPKPMADPCRQCPRAEQCRSADTYKCDLFRTVFVRAWDETVAFLKAQLIKKELT